MPGFDPGGSSPGFHMWLSRWAKRPTTRTGGPAAVLCVRSPRTGFADPALQTGRKRVESLVQGCLPKAPAQSKPPLPRADIPQRTRVCPAADKAEPLFRPDFMWPSCFGITLWRELWKGDIAARVCIRLQGKEKLLAPAAAQFKTPLRLLKHQPAECLLLSSQSASFSAKTVDQFLKLKMRMSHMT